jgi:hypothetical protein
MRSRFKNLVRFAFARLRQYVADQRKINEWKPRVPALRKGASLAPALLIANIALGAANVSDTNSTRSDTELCKAIRRPSTGRTCRACLADIRFIIFGE